MNFEEDIQDWQIEKHNTIIKAVDKHLIAESIAIEIKADYEVFGYDELNKGGFFFTLPSYEMRYDPIEKREILDIAKRILKEKYNIIIISENPLIIETFTN